MLFSRILSWVENKKKNKYVKNLSNDELVQELQFEGITDEKVLSTLKKVPRNLFVEKHLIGDAYQNSALESCCGQTVSQPYVVSYMVSSLKLKKTDSILEIGTGTGYQTAILSHLCKEVFTIERFNTLLNLAKKNIARLSITNVNFKLGNGIEGWGKELLFEKIIINATSKFIPEKLLESLKSNGLLIMPKKYNAENHYNTLQKIYKRKGSNLLENGFPKIWTLDFLKIWVNAGMSPICGNSIGTDRRFIKKEMPKLESFMHYRMIDVSTVKELARRWYPDLQLPEKNSSHLALDDIQDSIEELRWYRKTFFNTKI